MDELERLTAREKRFVMNRSFCILGGGYMTYSLYQMVTEPAPLGFCIAVFAIVAAIAFVGFTSHKEICSIRAQISDILDERENKNDAGNDNERDESDV